MEEVPVPKARWLSTEAGRHLAGRRSEDTAPEVLLGSTLHRMGLRYRKHVRLAKGCTPDLVLARHRVAVFVDGCFWHFHEEHVRTDFSGPNADLWREKMKRNRARDARATEVASSLGYTVVRLWECTVMRDPRTAAGCVAQHTDRSH